MVESGRGLQTFSRGCLLNMANEGPKLHAPAPNLYAAGLLGLSPQLLRFHTSRGLRNGSLRRAWVLGGAREVWHVHHHCSGLMRPPMSEVFMYVEVLDKIQNSFVSEVVLCFMTRFK